MKPERDIVVVRNGGEEVGVAVVVQRREHLGIGDANDKSGLGETLSVHCDRDLERARTLFPVEVSE